MKFLLTFLLASTAVFATQKAAKKTLPVTTDDKVLKQEMAKKDKLKLPEKIEEDCDEKAKKKVEIKPESISLTGNAGCSLDEAH